MKKTLNSNEFKMPEESFGDHNDAQEPSAPLGIILGVLIVILALALAGLYLWSTMLVPTTAPLEMPENEVPTETETTAPSSVSATNLENKPLSTSDEINDIEIDVTNTSFLSIEAAMNSLESEIYTSAEAN